jgi:integrase
VARRNSQEGSLYQRADGYWVASVSVGGGKRVVRYGKTRAEAVRKLQALSSEHVRGTLTLPTQTTLEVWVQTWMADRSLRPSTLRVYTNTLTPIVREMGSIRLDKLTPMLLSDAFGRLGRGRMGARQLQLGHGYLKSCLQRAVDMEILSRNPMTKVQRPRWEPKTRTYWTVEQASRFIGTCESSSSRWGPLFTVLVTCGLRISEALGLTWQDIDLVRQTLTVRQALVWTGGTYEIGPVKTTAGYRTISIPAPGMAALKKLRAKANEDQTFVFRSIHGNVPRVDQLHKPLATLCASAGVPRINVHGLRHVAAALAFRATGDPYAVQHRLGHSHISVTLGIYAYGTRSDEQVAGAVDALLAQNSMDHPGDPTDSSAS